METLLQPAYSTISLRKYSQKHQRAGYLTRGSQSQICLTTSRRIMPVSHLHDIHRKWNVKKSFKLSALADNQGHIENLPNEKYMSENEIPSTHVDDECIIKKKFKAFLKLCRPYAMMGVVLGVLSISLLPVQSIADFYHPAFFTGLVQAVVLGGLLQLYMIAVNELFDVEIDKINKQHFAFASGELSQGDVVAICLAVTALNIGIVYMSKSPALLCALVVNYVVATGYSAQLPFLRWKKHPLLALPSMMSWMAFGVQIPHFIHIQGISLVPSNSITLDLQSNESDGITKNQKYVLGRPNPITKVAIFQTLILTAYTLAGMILKDVPDVEGDRQNGIETLATRFGVERAFSIGTNVALFAPFVLGMVVAASSSLQFGKLIEVLGHVAILLVIHHRSRRTDPTNKSSAQSFYMLVWQLAGVEYLLIQFVR